MTEFKVGDRVEFNDPGYDYPYDHGYGVVTRDAGNGVYVVRLDNAPTNDRDWYYYAEELTPESKPVVDTFPRVIQSLDTWYAAYGLEPTHKVVPIDAVVTMPEPQQGAWQVTFQALGTKDDALAITDLVRDAVESAGLTLRGNTKVTVDNWLPSTEKVD